MNEDVNNYLRLAIMEEVNKRMGKNFECINDLITYAENLAKENEQLKQQVQNLTLMLESERKVRVNTESLQEICKLENQIEKMKCYFNCDKPIKHQDCGDCHNGSNWELMESDRLIRS